MATVARTTKHIIQAYKAVRSAEIQTQAKLDALLETNSLYKLFDFESHHPYYFLAAAGKKTQRQFEELVSGLMDWTVEVGTIGEELDRVKARQVVNGELDNPEVDALRLIQPVAMTTADASAKLLEVLHSASATWSKASPEIIRSDLENVVGRKNVPRHLESPVLKVSPVCRAAVKELASLTKELLYCGVDNQKIRDELLIIQSQNQKRDFLLDKILNGV